jgi:hypothetical protein
MKHSTGYAEGYQAGLSAAQAGRAHLDPAQEPEIVQRVRRYAGKTLRTARNPNITARECIELANWIAANTAQSSATPSTDQDLDQLVVEYAIKADCVPEICTYVDYHPDQGRVPEHWRASPTVIGAIKHVLATKGIK